MRHTEERTRQVAVKNSILLIAATLVLILMAISSSSAATTECPREHHGDLIIEGAEVFTISDETFCQYGNIDVRDNGRLVITNATVQMEVSDSNIWGNWAHINLHDSASMEIRDSALEMQTGGVWITAFDSSHVVLSSTKSTSANGISFTARGRSKVEITLSTLMELRIKELATVHIQDSKVVWAVDITFKG